MQRVLFEILRRASEGMDRHNTKKRKAEILATRDDGKFAEETFNRDSRGARPGMVAWPGKRFRTEDWGITGMRKMYDCLEL